MTSPAACEGTGGGIPKASSGGKHRSYGHSDSPPQRQRTHDPDAGADESRAAGAGEFLDYTSRKLLEHTSCVLAQPFVIRRTHAPEHERQAQRNSTQHRHAQPCAQRRSRREAHAHYSRRRLRRARDPDPCGRGSVARDAVVNGVEDTISTYSSSSKIEAQLRRFERRGGTARKRLEREVRKTRTRFERGVRQRRRELDRQRNRIRKDLSAQVEQAQEQFEKTQAWLGDTLKSRIDDSSELAGRVQERVLSEV